jgi:hypothetical protein
MRPSTNAGDDNGEIKGTRRRGHKQSKSTLKARLLCHQRATMRDRALSKERRFVDS